MQLILIASLLGIIGPYIDFSLCMALFLLLFILLIFMRFECKIIIVLISCSLFFYIYTNYKVDKFDTKYFDTNVNMSVKIVSYRSSTNYYDKYIANNRSNEKFIIFLEKGDEIPRGTVLNIIGDFKLPDLARNTGGFNYRRYLNSQGIFGNVYVSKYYIEEVSKFNFIYFIQDKIYESFSKLFPTNEMGLVLGMLIGDTKDISEDVLEDFKIAGITHLMAVSRF